MEVIQVKLCLMLLIPLIALSFMVSGAFATQNMNFTGPSILTTKIVKVNKEFVVALESNPATGYSWTAEYDPNYLKLVNSKYILYKTKPCTVGSGGVQIFTFKSIKPGKTMVTMGYQRPWEETVHPLKEVKYAVLAYR